MTIKRMLTLQKLLILCCVGMLILIGVKCYYIQQKITAVTEADRLYALNDLIGAEEWYLQAHRNKSIRYKEQEVSLYLQELAPISEMNSTLNEIDDAAKKAYAKDDFEQLMTVYAELSDFRAIYMKDSNTYAPYYRQISAKYEISEDFTTYFQDFRTLFYEQLEHNLDNKQYADESFKWNLLTIPEPFFGDADQKKSQLYAKFKAYDQRKLAQMAAKGEFQTLLDESIAMLEHYDSRQIQADWITEQTDSLVRTFLEHDADKEAYSTFAVHAKSYTSFIQSVKFDSTVESYITKQIDSWMSVAKRAVKNTEFNKALALYEGLANYMDTSSKVKETKLAWNIHDPIRILQNSDPTRVFTVIDSGSKRFGAVLYVLAQDEQNIIYFARMDSEDKVHILTNDHFQQDEAIQDIAIESSLSIEKFPVLLIQGESSTRNTRYTAIEVQTESMVTLFEFHADGYQVDSDGQLLLDNPDTPEGAGQVAIYQRSGESYSFVGFQQDYIDIVVEDLLLYIQEKVRFSTNIIQPGYSEAFAIMGDSYLKLTGNYSFYEGTAIVTGRFSGYEDFYIEDELTSIPLFEVESME
ncbi:hypothetical protein [Paenibacillus crassostreae]|uniref:Uncharacterized protein n=1 Tax=Paenibacillus crassostreae TaxID=1763538 RepID=A0A167BWX2_9BACL|nr:hypothetical protein [Paenibacillus crassostreae]AOZ92586.1 hypothetical protein LPB68_10285 [Paenibacillus crassostreae]OAB72535.1 hypothetical protein PNBC_16730 [Paenibacillus crassostreae]